MALLERVAALVRANLNDLIDTAEDPHKTIRNVLLDMENQFLQVKTQVAIAIAGQHVLERKQRENQDKAAEWERKAEMAVDKGRDDLARAALDRSLTYRGLADNLAQQVADQKLQVETLKSALRKLEEKLAEAQSLSEVLAAQHRRSRALAKAGEAQTAAAANARRAVLDRLREEATHAEAVSAANAQLASDDVERRLAALGKQDQVEHLLAELKARRKRP